MANPLENLDFNSPEFISNVNLLADHFNISKHPNHLITLEAITKLVKKNYGKDAARETHTGKNIELGVEDFGFSYSDPVLNNASKILRLLYIQDIRDLQTKINETIVDIQKVTADPRTDTRLGKVGR